MRTPLPKGTDQTISPVFALMRIPTTASAFSSTEVKKTASPQTAGVEAPSPGSSLFHATPSVGEKTEGKPVPVDDPLKWGPRQFGQFSACNVWVPARVARVAASEKRAGFNMIERVRDR